MADIEKETLDVARKTSIYAFAALVAITVLSVYLVQRACIEAFTDITDAQGYPMGSQATVYDLKFVFGTMSVVWPALLGSGMLAFGFLSMRRQQLWALLPESSGLSRRLDILQVDLEAFPAARVSVMAITIVPVIAIWMHFGAPLVAGALLVWDQLTDLQPKSLQYRYLLRDGAVYILRILTVAYALVQLRRFRQNVPVFFGQSTVRQPTLTQAIVPSESAAP